MGLCWGVATGDMTTAISVALFFELFWMDLIPAGTFLPPNMLAPTLGTLTLAAAHALSGPSQIVWVMLATMPLAGLGRHIEGALRAGQNANYTRLLKDVRGVDTFRPEPMVRGALLRFMAANWLFFVLAVGLVGWGFDMLRPVVIDLSAWLPLQWWQLWFAASIGGLLSIRLRRGYVLLACGVVVVLCVIFFTSDAQGASFLALRHG